MAQPFSLDLMYNLLETLEGGATFIVGLCTPTQNGNSQICTLHHHCVVNRVPCAGKPQTGYHGNVSQYSANVCIGKETRNVQVKIIL